MTVSDSQQYKPSELIGLLYKFSFVRKEQKRKERIKAGYDDDVIRCQFLIARHYRQRNRGTSTESN